MKDIKKPRASTLPIEPTAKPSPEDLLKVAISLVKMSQECILSPSAVIAVLRCSLDVYTQNAMNRGFDLNTAQECERLGQALAKAFLDANAKKMQVPASPLVDASGAPLQAAEATTSEG